MPVSRIATAAVSLAVVVPSLAHADGWQRFRPDDSRLASVQAKLDKAGDYVITWAPLDDHAAVEVMVGTSPNSISPKDVVMSSRRTAVVVSGLDQSKRWYFKVAQEREHGTVVAERLIPLAGANNFRDLGGYLTVDGRTTKWGVFYRSDDISKLTAADVAYLEGMGLKLDIDLRTDAEVASKPDAVTGTFIGYKREMILGVNTNIASLFADPSVKFDIAGMAAFYDQTLDQNATVYANMLRDLAENGPGAVFHCSGGKDRAGMGAALLLAVVGVADEAIVNDYALTEQYEAVYLSQQLPAFQAMLKAAGIDPSRLGFLMGSPPAVMVEVLSHLRSKYGSVEEYLKSGGLDSATIAKLRAEFIN